MSPFITRLLLISKAYLLQDKQYYMYWHLDYDHEWGDWSVTPVLLIMHAYVHILSQQ